MLPRLTQTAISDRGPPLIELLVLPATKRERIVDQCARVGIYRQ